MRRIPVFISKCAGYGPELADALQVLLASSGVFDNISGKRVLVKPNLLTDRNPEQAVTTHPELLRLVLRELKKRGASVSVGDSPASAANLDAVLATTGIGRVCEEEGVPFVRFEQEGVLNFEEGTFRFPLAKAIAEADLLVNLPKVKSHALTKLTAAVKNLYGAVPGYAKTTLHRLYPKPAVFGRLLQTLWKQLPPCVSIADAVVGMEGQGPANGTPVDLGFLAASENPYALDIALCSILHIARKGVPYLTGVDIEPELRGDDVQVSSFAVPAGAHLLSLLPAWFVRAATSIVWVRPAFSESCIHCGKCVRACPGDALTIRAKGHPELVRERCIACACCHEVCPVGAIHMTQSALLRLMGVFKGIR